MSKVLLIYPYFKPRGDRSVFRFPPLGVSYLAASLIQAGHEVQVIDCTFTSRTEALERAKQARAEVVGIYCMVTMLEDCLWMARQLRPQTRLLVVGGPLATCEPQKFARDFDILVRGEAEHTLVEVLRAYESGGDYSSIAGIIINRGDQGSVSTPDRPFIMDLDSLPFPARGLLPNSNYIQFGKKEYGYAITTVMSTRGCPYQCEFCSNVIFGGSYRERSARSVVDEIEEALALGYERISFADDVFTLNQRRVLEICAEIKRRGLHFYWECLARVDSITEATYVEMFQAGCRRVYFGIELGDDSILKLMRKKITAEQARQAVQAAHQAGLQVGAFFILFYPGDTNQTVLNTLRFATTLPVDYLGLSMPYPLPGTALYQRIQHQIRREWHPGESVFGSHVLIYKGEFSETKMWLGIFKGKAQFEINRRMRKSTRLAIFSPLFRYLFERPTDWLLCHLR